MTIMANQQDLQKEYDLRFEAMQEYRENVWEVLVREYFGKWIPKQSTVLDLGCGWGEFINTIDCQTKYGMDLNPRSREKLQPSVSFLQQDCSEVWKVQEASLDFVFTSNFFEHLPKKESLTRTLAQAHRCLKKGGAIICMGPNIRYLPGAYWDFYDHYLPLTHLSLKEGLRMSGFTVETCIDRFLPYTMADGTQPPLWMVSLYLKIPFVWRILGKQFLLVGRKI